MCNHQPQHIPGNCPPQPFKGLDVEPYTQEEIACIRGPKYDFNPIVVPIHERWLLTLDALQARLAAAEAAVAVRDALLARCRPYVCTIPAGRVDPESAHDGDQIAHAIDTLRGDASAKEAPRG